MDSAPALVEGQGLRIAVEGCVGAFKFLLLLNISNMIYRAMVRWMLSTQQCRKHARFEVGTGLTSSLLGEISRYIIQVASNFRS